MFILNFKKDWKMHKSLLVVSVTVSVLLLLVVSIIYFITRYGNLPRNTNAIFMGVLGMLMTIVFLAALIIPISLMYFVLKDDLGKNRIQYTIFTPQSLLSWYLPKLLYIFIIQGLFALINLCANYFTVDLTNHFATKSIEIITFTMADHILTFLTTTFSFGFFAMMTLCFALYYSFRKNGLRVILQIVTVFLYFISYILYPVISQIHNTSIQITLFVGNATGMEIIIPFLIKNALGLLYLFIAYFLFEYKIEY